MIERSQPKRWPVPTISGPAIAPDNLTPKAFWETTRSSSRRDNAQAQRQSQSEQDGSEVKSVELERLTRSNRHGADSIVRAVVARAAVAGQR
jgi:hypothetical protein